VKRWGAKEAGTLYKPCLQLKINTTDCVRNARKAVLKLVFIATA
jgi:hypothetical protein